MKLSAVISAAALTLALSAVSAFADGIGDINSDGDINVTDLMMISAHVKSEKPLQEECFAFADANEDGDINVTDVMMVAAHVKGLRSLDGSFVAPEPEPEPEPEPTGPVIEVIDGVTYVDGILIANKSYALPQNYGNGLTTETLNAFYDMQRGASYDGISLWICSGFRSYWDQNYLYWNYVKRDGQAAADTYSARPGHSEHQTGLAIDINNASRSFNGSREAQWIAAHCAEYGFILRYPQGKEDKTGFMYESWHVRYVGKELAGKITDSGLCLEEYLGIDSYYH
ncbi:D-alanyl-D-alanine carboxypeptidase family protein [Ruminococcus sp.]|uniref:D-alanyl-D-alanine carboxypeptidase family protein n=1 Tax=Ruminococcus sp. TaxID=41978 RepID=UPI0025CBDFE4|nr:D-alanyl-D-alanine carboxypeptidase family protein [Ruminococcus sp.]MBQ8966501.1 D-alanyl-D-alanine carboxypeptidase family protein [Ruminococcus sp.]